MRVPKNHLTGSLGRTSLLVVGLLLILAPATQGAITISEIRIDNPGADTDEYFELTGNPGESLSGITYIVIGDASGTSCGTIEAAIDLTGQSIPAVGDPMFVVGESSATIFTPDLVTTLPFENSDNVTHMIVTGFTGATGNDIDANDDGVIDFTPWTTILDEVGLDEGTVPDCVSNEYLYSATTIGPDGIFVPGHVKRCPTGWLIGEFTLGVDDTPGATNICAVVPDVTNVIGRPLLPEPGEAVTVTADASDGDGTISAVDLFYQVNGGGYTSTSMTLVAGTTYSGTIPAALNGDLVEYYVQATDNDANTATNPATAPAAVFSYTVAPETILPIANIHANLGLLLGTVVQVEAQVYCPGDYKQDGGVSAYVQDGSGRGLNVFGSNFSTGFADLNSTGNIVKISGTLTTFDTTVELVSYEVELVSTGNPPLTPSAQASTATAAAPSNEGTYIQATGVITEIVTTGTTGVNLAFNATVNDCSGPVVVRVDEDLDPAFMTNFPVGDEITASGAGSSFSGQGQIIVCSIAEVTNNGTIGDVCPPDLLTAALTAGTQVTLTFDESIDPTTGNTAGNYEVFETATPANTIAVNAAAVQVTDTEVILTLGSAPSAGVDYTVRVSNVEDLSGNAISPPQSVALFDPNPTEVIVITEIMQNPSVLFDSDGEWFEVRNDGPSAVDMNGWTIEDDGSDVHVIANGGPLTINPGEYKVFVRNATAMAAEGVVAFYEYGADITLSNSADEVVLQNTLTQEVDRVVYDGGTLWPDPNGHSMQWNDTGDNNDGTNWSGEGAPIFGSGDRGTPGAVNDFTTPVPGVPTATLLEDNYPNPFNPTTSFSFSLKHRERATLAVYNVRGQLVRTVVDAMLDPGVHDEFQWDGKNDAGRQVTSGTYFYRLSTESGFVDSKKMTLVK